MDITAFPCHGSMGEVVQEGMSLRAYIAAKTLASIVVDNHASGNMDHGECAQQAVQYADALLFELEMPGPARENYERQIESANARADRMAATLRRLVDALSPTQILAGEAPLVDAIAVLDDDEMIPF